MRVQYTLPGYQPELKPLPPPEEGDTPSFQRQIRSPQWQGAADWKRVLNVDRVPSSPSSIGPPPRPLSLESREPATERMRWHQLLTRHTTFSPMQNGSQSSDKVSSMMFLLVQAQQAADAVTARSLEGERA
jgi:hypothetical protein